MAVLRSLFLEDPRTLWVVLGIGEVFALVALTRGRARWKLGLAAALPAVAVLLGLLDWAVETDYEKVRRSVRLISAAAKARDADAVVERISDAYASGPYRKGHLANLARRSLRQVTVRPASPFPPRISLKGGAATVRYTYRVDSLPGSGLRIHQDVTWEGTFGPDPDGEWRLREVMMTAPFRRRPEEYVPLVLPH